MTVARMLPLAAVALLTTACGGGTPTVDRAQLEDRVSAIVEKQSGSAPGRVTCADDLTGKVGTTVRCTLTRDGDDVPLQVRVTSVRGDRVNFWIAPTVLQAALENQVSAALEQMAGVAPDDVSCPDDLVGRVGETMRCTLTARSDELGLTVTVDRVEGQQVHFKIAVDQTKQGESPS